ncbi:YraN family protein [Desmonostoc muscorum LEGE 12446]|nr:YraN family protein [Desmonostoc muscorum]MCF2148897.1 YraN family protein [Desmonostoc muscorum LEGE 12446]
MHCPNSGQFGEDLVAQWLQSTGWVILHRRFSCRWGEIDIIAEHHRESGEEQKSKAEYPTPHSLLPTPLPILAFVEVKTRSSGSWDTGGRSAVTPQKQAKISRTAGIFLAQYPEKADYPCRFDVAIVYCQELSKKTTGVTATQEALASSSAAGYEFRLQEYILAAFDCIN